VGVRPPAVAVLAPPSRVVAATTAVAVALARVHRSRWALAGVLGATAPSAGSAVVLPAAARAAARLRRSGRGAAAAGRVVWLALSDAPPGDLSDDEPGNDPLAQPVDGASVIRLARELGVPAALGVARARSAGLDRALARYDAIVVVREADAAADLTDLVLTSLAELDRPVSAMAPLGRLAAALSTTGLHAPAAALRVVGGVPRTGR
jgi:hypothetical protein